MNCRLTKNHNSQMPHIQEKRYNKFPREKVFLSILLYAVMFIVGWINGLFGPSFIDLQLISDVTLKLGSWISTLNAIGYGIGCLIGGILFDKFNKNGLYGTGLLLVGIVTASIPWCVPFALMSAAHACQGFAAGSLDTAVYAHMMKIWPDNKMMFFFTEFSLLVGAFLAPIAVAPFLSDKSKDNDVYHQINETLHNATFRFYSQNTPTIPTAVHDIERQTISQFVDNTSGSQTFGNETKHTGSHITISRLFVPYSIGAALAVSVSLPFIFKYFMKDYNSNDETINRSSEEKRTRSRTLPTNLKVVCLTLISIFLLICTSLGSGFKSFIVVYCVDEVGFSPTDGALVSAVSNVCCIVSIIVSIFVSRISTLVLLGIHIVGLLFGVIALLLSSVAHFDVGIWISAAVVGYFKAMIFSLSFTWTNNYITPTTGKIASLYMVCSCIGSAVVPPLLGWLMEEYSNLWFCFLLIIFGVCILLVYIVGMVLTKYVTTLYGKTFYKTALSDIPLTEKLNNHDDDNVVE